MDDKTIDKAVALAMNPREGVPFTFGGRKFTLQFLTCDGEDRIVNLLMPRIQALIAETVASGKPMPGQKAMMAAMNDLLPEATAIILGDYDPAIDLAWVRSVRAPRLVLTMYDLVAAQFELNDLGKLLAGRLQTDAMLSARENATA